MFDVQNPTVKNSNIHSESYINVKKMLIQSGEKMRALPRLFWVLERIVCIYALSTVMAIVRYYGQ